MEDIDCQSEQLIAPNKLQMFCMHSCSIYLFMCINFKKKAVKSVSVLALSLQSFICLQAVRCRVCIFFPSVFFYIFLSRRLSSGHESSQRLRCCSVLSLTVVFFFLRFLFFWSVFAPLLKKFRAHVQRPRGQHGQKWAEMADGSLRWFLISLWKSQKQKHKLSVRTYQHAAPPHLRQWWCAQVGHRFGPLPQSPGR